DKAYRNNSGFKPFFFLLQHNYNWEFFLQPHLTTIKNFNNFHAFHIFKNEAGIPLLKYKQWSHHVNWNGLKNSNQGIALLHSFPENTLPIIAPRNLSQDVISQIVNNSIFKQNATVEQQNFYQQLLINSTFYFNLDENER